MFRTFTLKSCLKLVCVLGLFAVASGCLEQYDPEPHNKIFNREYEASMKAPVKLSETGELPTPAQAVSIDTKYQNFCASCHGAQGGGDGPAGAALNPKPRNFVDKQWQASVTDDHILLVIKSGGPAAGLSPMMAPWGGVLNEAELKEMTALVRNFGK